MTATATASAPAEATTRTRYKWSADEKAALIADFEATKGDKDARDKMLTTYSEKTGAQPQSIVATYYAAKAKSGSPVGTPRGARTAKPQASTSPILDRVSQMVARKSEIEAALDPKAHKALARELKQIDKALAAFG